MISLDVTENWKTKTKEESLAIGILSKLVKDGIIKKDDYFKDIKGRIEYGKAYYAVLEEIKRSMA